MDDQFLKSVLAKLHQVPADDIFAQECREQIKQMARAAKSERDFYTMLHEYMMYLADDLQKQLDKLPPHLRQLYEASKRRLQ